MYPEDITPVNIIKTAISLWSFLRTSADSGLCGPDVHVVSEDYSPQDLVNLACLVDRGREFSVDNNFQQKVKTQFYLVIASYKLGPGKTLEYYLDLNVKEPPESHESMFVFRRFDPAFCILIWKLRLMV